LTIAAFAIAVIWAEPRPSPDLEVSLPAGRDVVQGKLGKGDDWAFTTGGRVCIDQNWGSHLLIYWVHGAAGPTGLLVLKAALIAATALFICLASRQRQVSWPVALLVAAGAIAAGRSYIELRPALITLLFVPLALWLMLKTRANVHWVWPVMILNGVWANMHAGFIFGLGMMGLWVVVWCTAQTVAVLREHKPLSAGIWIAAGRLWPLPVALAGSVLLEAFANPFGPVNLTYPLVTMDPAWQEVREWWPLLAKGVEFGTAWEFLVFLGVLGGLLLLRVAGIPGMAGSAVGRPDVGQLAQAVFDVVLAAVVIGMTFQARRFAPLAVIVCAPFVAVQVQWLFGLLARAHRVLPPLALTAAAVALAVPLLVHVETLRRIYHPRSPNFPPESFFDRMHMRWIQPLGAGEFLAANQITGRVFHEWEWEGYLHWRCPALKLFIGARGHQVYDLATHELARRIMTDARAYQVDPTGELVGAGVHIVVVPIDPKYTPLLWHLVERPQASWGYVYCDPREVVAVDLAWRQTAELARRAVAGEMTYPDPLSAALSRAMAMQAPRLAVPARARLEALLAAVEVHPTFMAYRAIHDMVRDLPAGDPSWRQEDYFRRQYARLETMDPNQADGLQIVSMRAQLALYLAEFYRRAGDGAQALRWTQAQNQVIAEAKAMVAYWP
jgi:hypothetical protein